MSEQEAILHRLQRIETDLTRHLDKDEKSFKYTHNMLEDLGEKLSSLERSAARFEADLVHRSLNDQNAQKWLGGIEGRLQNIERLVWIAVGGVVVIGGLVSFIGSNILKFLR